MALSLIRSEFAAGLAAVRAQVARTFAVERTVRVRRSRRAVVRN